MNYVHCRRSCALTIRPDHKDAQYGITREYSLVEDLP